MKDITIHLSPDQRSSVAHVIADAKEFLPAMSYAINHDVENIGGVTIFHQGILTRAYDLINVLVRTIEITYVLDSDEVDYFGDIQVYDMADPDVAKERRQHPGRPFGDDAKVSKEVQK